MIGYGNLPKADISIKNSLLMFEFDIVCQPWGFRQHRENNQQSVDRNCRHSFQTGSSHSTHLCFSLLIFAVLGIRGTYFLTAFIVAASCGDGC